MCNDVTNTNNNYQCKQTDLWRRLHSASALNLSSSLETIKGESSDSIVADGDQWIWKTEYRYIKQKLYFKN